MSRSHETVYYVAGHAPIFIAPGHLYRSTATPRPSDCVWMVPGTDEINRVDQRELEHSVGGPPVSRATRKCSYDYAEHVHRTARHKREARGGPAATVLTDAEFDARLAAVLLKEKQDRWRRAIVAPMSSQTWRILTE
jgi:hypothetical protein